MKYPFVSLTAIMTAVIMVLAVAVSIITSDVPPASIGIPTPTAIPYFRYRVYLPLWTVHPQVEALVTPQP